MRAYELHTLFCRDRKEPAIIITANDTVSFFFVHNFSFSFYTASYKSTRINSKYPLLQHVLRATYWVRE